METSEYKKTWLFSKKFIFLINVCAANECAGTLAQISDVL